MKSTQCFALVLAIASFCLCGISRGDDVATTASATTQIPDLPLPDGSTMLPNGWKLSPAGKATQLAGDMPTQMFLTADGKYLLTATGGYNEHGISVIDVATRELIDHAKVPATFAGMCIDPKGEHVLLSEGGATRPAVAYSFKFEEGHLTPEKNLRVEAIPRDRRFIGGLACGKDGSVYIVSIREGKVYKTNATGSDTIDAKVGYRPCAIALSPDGQALAVADWGDKAVEILNAVDLKPICKVEVGSHPAAVAWSTDGRIFVANSGANTVSVVSLSKSTVIETIRTSLDFQVPVGSTPMAVAVDSIGKRLYVANADNNDVAVVDISEAGDSNVLGFIPTGWYPCALALSADGKQLFIGTGKALDHFAPNIKPMGDGRPGNPRNAATYIGNMLTGHVSFVTAPDEKALAGYTRQVLTNSPVPFVTAQLAKEQRDVLEGAFHKIKHVVYVIKENRTYDQVFGDLPQGNGDPSVCMFGKKVTPNHHAIARQWVLLDNLYCNGEVSVDGHAWCDAAYASDFTQRSWTNSYSKHPALDADERLNRQPGGYIWDNAIAHKLSFMSYGEGASFLASPEKAPDADDVGMQAGVFSKPWQQAGWKMGGGKRDYQRINIFIDDLHAGEKSGNWPALMVMSLPEDHTSGRKVGTNTPDACVASNDLGVGALVDAVSHSKFWPETAIFIIEDDAQNGQDHVDAHRTVGLVISPYTRRGVVDHTMYTTASMIRTIELMLNLPPMTQYDAAATPMFNSFTESADLRPYTQLKQQVDLAAINPPQNPGARASAELDFTDLDRAAPDKLNAILWDWFKPGTQMPAPVRSMVFVR